MNGCFPLGAAIGALIAGHLIIFLTPRKTMLAADICGILGSLLSLIANEYSFLVARIINGFLAGLDSS